MRFGPICFDCSGFTYMAYKSQGLTIPADSASVAKWGRTNGQVHSVAQAKLSDLLIHDKYGDPYNSTGPRGHIGIFIRLDGDRVITYESASSHEGVGVYSRTYQKTPGDGGFWLISVQHPAFASIPQPAPTEDDLTPEQAADLKGVALRMIDLEDKVGWILAYLKDGGYDKRADGKPSRVEAIYDKTVLGK